MTVERRAYLRIRRPGTWRVTLLACCTAVASWSCGASTALAQPQPLASVVQQPTFGVAIDADGLLAVQHFPDPTGHLRIARLTAARQQLPANLWAWSALRKVSLPRLEAALRRNLAEGRALDEELQHVAGLQRVEFVFLYPQTEEIVLAGPAEGWAPDPSGRMVGATTFRPVLLLEDLAAALRAYPAGQRAAAFVGCTISPDPQGLARYVKTQQDIPRSVAPPRKQEAAIRISAELRASLGQAHISVFGVPASTHAAQVMIEADYRMKLMAMGIEPPPLRMATFANSLRKAPPNGNLQRWWLTPDYNTVRVSPDGLALEFKGQGVQLSGEDKIVDREGRLQNSGRELGWASGQFTSAFTGNYERIAELQPVYGQLRGIVDLLIAAAFLDRQDAYEKCRWQPDVLVREAALSIETHPEPRRTACVANAVWKGNRLLVFASGGVSIQATTALVKAELADGALDQRRVDLPWPEAVDAWWWD